MNWPRPQWVSLCRYLRLVSVCLVALTAACIGPTSPADSQRPPSGKPEFGKAAQGASPVASPAAASLLSGSPVAPSPLSDAEATALVASRQATAIAVQDEHLAATAQAAFTVPAPPMPANQAPTGGTGPTAAAGLSVPPDLPSARVVRVVDGDTADVELAGQTVRLRLIGMDTPETVDPRTAVQCFGREASARAKEMLEGQTVHLEADSSQDERDTFGRLLRYVWLGDGRLFNLEMIAEGFAHEYTFRTPHKYQGQFRAAQAEAREQERGLWSPQTCGGNTEQPADRAAAPAVPGATAISASETPRPAAAAATMAPASKTGNCHPSYPDVCIPPPPPDLNCGSIPHRDFRVVPPDPHRFDGDQDGVGCESTSRSR